MMNKRRRHYVFDYAKAGLGSQKFRAPPLTKEGWRALRATGWFSFCSCGCTAVMCGKALPVRETLFKNTEATPLLWKTKNKKGGLSTAFSQLNQNRYF
jgi:hypothetical protein